ncbi:hypothetical protein GCM10009127_09990 [Alteraurantiacibacter aestuarii]|uniref:Lipocalin-like domain-containing protein n=1 Tax=Alteraurantiacibacter aestuarii TaxID=650004 RepID=A0A844ZKH0_9SPHN|nr:hypothetical protein [Alteraurantiacibacter aestuarii]MXO87387.1 hypothetical protein [Alteraurantiacibacter aestuarii]
MKKLIACAACLAILSACSETSDDAAQESAETVQPVSDFTFEEHLGAWDVVYPDETTAVTTNRPDGTFTTQMADGTVSEGTWSMQDDGSSCWMPTGEDEPRCYTIGAADENGTRALTMPDGQIAYVTPVQEEDAAAE